MAKKFNNTLGPGGWDTTRVIRRGLKSKSPPKIKQIHDPKERAFLGLDKICMAPVERITD